ncbi:class I SAM-dependent methyltransferase [Acidobacteria bacterium AH-259-D05]|nr:class I SAM-dependent methyltransferase [Acidobacteria bacterium AH-259-D05]
MYDFYFGTPEEIGKDEKKYLISIKRMLPRWVNSLPDSEYIALANILDEKGKDVLRERSPVYIETGAGASSLVFAFYALKYDGLSISWDLNGEKGSLIRTICTETMCNYFSKHIDTHWKLVAFSSISPHLGLPMLEEMVDHVDVFFHDSEHVWNTIRKELECILPLLRDGSVVALDDAHLNVLHTNFGYINTLRKKLGLPSVPGSEDNTCEPFYVETERLLRKYFKSVEGLPDVYKKEYMEDPYYTYYGAECELNKKTGALRAEELEHRFESWKVRC